MPTASAQIDFAFSFSLFSFSFLLQHCCMCTSQTLLAVTQLHTQLSHKLYVHHRGWGMLLVEVHG